MVYFLRQKISLDESAFSDEKRLIEKFPTGPSYNQPAVLHGHTEIFKVMVYKGDLLAL